MEIFVKLIQIIEKNIIKKAMQWKVKKVGLYFVCPTLKLTNNQVQYDLIQ